MIGEHNWAANHTFQATRIHSPRSIGEVRRIVAGASRVHAIGARHSFNAIADCAGDLIDLSGIAPDFVIDPDRCTVTGGAGTNYGVLAAWLQREGWALHNMASLPHVTLAGATATGTHGSGDRLGTLSSAVAGLEIVTATGDLLSIGRRDESCRRMSSSPGMTGKWDDRGRWKQPRTAATHLQPAIHAMNE